ncbi:MAG: hypothetical protein ACFE89_04905 [Candidatus Hodarchaeota archaeon]
MASSSLPRIVVKSLEAILGELFIVTNLRRLPSRRNEVYKIEGVIAPDPSLLRLVAKLYHAPGIAQESSILRQAIQQQIPVPRVLGTTTEVLLLEYIDGPNLCDLITVYPAPHYAHLLAAWFAQFHSAFTRNSDQVLLKGDARIRNFLVSFDRVVGVDFEESQTGSYIHDLAVVCGSILDTTPLFTTEKWHLCQKFLQWYSVLRPVTTLAQLTSETTRVLIKVLHETATRRGHPSDFLKLISQLENGDYTL